MRGRITEIANRLLDAVAGQTSFDVVDAYAKPLPTIVIATMLGVNESDQENFKRWSDDRAHIFNPTRTPEQQVPVERSQELALTSPVSTSDTSASGQRGYGATSVWALGRRTGTQILHPLPKVQNILYRGNSHRVLGIERNRVQSAATLAVSITATYRPAFPGKPASRDGP